MQLEENSPPSNQNFNVCLSMLRNNLGSLNLNSLEHDAFKLTSKGAPNRHHLEGEPSALTGVMTDVNVNAVIIPVIVIKIQTRLGLKVRHTSGRNVL